jgi:hypothetical protein
MRFNLAAARKAADEAPHRDYDAAFSASDNLRWTLSNQVVASDEKPLGRAVPAPAPAPPAK